LDYAKAEGARQTYLIFAGQRLSKRAYLTKQYPQDTVTDAAPPVTLAGIAGKPNQANQKDNCRRNLLEKQLKEPNLYACDAGRLR
jgi:hypothetical protein